MSEKVEDENFVDTMIAEVTSMKETMVAFMSKHAIEEKK